ncbi:MAG: hypothetical protein Q8Q39_05425 [bacterium]|nr:hypothetical protein [bacterium]
MPKHTARMVSQKQVAEFFKRFGDGVFFAIVAAVIGFAALWFYWYVYPPIFLSDPPQAQKPIFNSQVYEQVIGRIESNDAQFAEKVNALPRNPFAELPARVDQSLLEQDLSVEPDVIE